MLKLLAAFHLDQPDSLKRALATALGALFVTLINPLLLQHNMPPVSDEVLMSVAGMLAAFVLQSAAKSIATANAAGAAAAAKVDAPEKADAALGVQAGGSPPAGK